MNDNKQNVSKLFVLLTLNLAILLWGFSGLFGKWVETDSTTLTFWRMATAWLTLGAFFILTKRRLLPVFRKDLIWKNILCGILLAAHWFYFFKVIQMSTVAMGIVFSASFVFMVAALEPLLLNVKQNRIVVVSAIIGSVALVITLYSQIVKADLIIWVYGLTSAATLAAISLLNRSILVKDDPVQCVTAQLFYGAVLLFGVSLVLGVDLFTISQDNIWKIALLGIFTTGVGHTIYFWSLRYVTATKAGVMTLLEPAYGIIFGVILLQEIPTKEMIVGSTIIIICAAVVALFSTVVGPEAGDEQIQEDEKV